MTTETDALPEEVRKAHESFQAIIGSVPREHRAVLETLTDGILDLVRQKLELIARVRELERLNAELCNSTPREKNLIARLDRLEALADRNRERKRAERAETELAAIKKRIAEAETFVVHRHPAGAVMATYMCNSKLDGKRVALLPLDDEAKS